MTTGPLGAEELPDDVTVRPATPADLLGIVRVLDAAALETDAEEIRDRLHAEPPRAFVAVASGRGSDERDDPTAADVVGALVLGGGDRFPDSPGTVWIESLAVRRRRQDRGIGRTLVDAACALAADLASPGEVPRVWAALDPDVRPFYEACGFEIVEGNAEEDRERDDRDRDDRLRAFLTLRESDRA